MIKLLSIIIIDNMGNQPSTSAISGTNIKQNRWFQPALKPGKILVSVKQNVPKPNQRQLIRLFSLFTPVFCPIFFALLLLDEKKFAVFAIIFLLFLSLEVKKETILFPFFSPALPPLINIA